ncbi:MAG: serine kinase, partial [Cyanobacteria bacterium P01_H01_bin.15]
TALPYFLERLRLLLKKQRVQRVEPRGEIKNYYGDRIRSGVHFSPDSFSLFDRQTQMGLYWTEDAQTLPYYERSSPLRMILSWWLKDLGYQYVHAAAVGTEHQGALLVGAGGSGKSMAALACVDSSLQYLSDDYCAIAVDPVPQIYSLYNSAKLWRAADIARLTVLTPLFDTSASNAEKHIAFLTQLGRDVLRKTVPARTVLLVRHVSQPQTTYRPIASGVVLKGLLPWTLLQLPNAGGETAQLLKRFLQPLPCFELLTGTDLSQIPTTIQSIFSTLSRS